MARSNKYASLNFNDIYEKKIISTHNPTANNKHSSSSSQSSSLTNHSKTVLSNSRIHGHMLVLSRPSPKPINTPQPAPVPHPSSPGPLPQQQQQQQQPDQTRLEPDSISLRPLGRTGSAPPLHSSSSSLSLPPLTSPKPEKELSPLPKTDRFVPPHLRPGFAGREEKPGPSGPVARSRDFAGSRQGHFGSPNRYGEDARPKSGGGYERMRSGGESNLVGMSRPGSIGTRPSSSG